MLSLQMDEGQARVNMLCECLEDVDGMLDILREMLEYVEDPDDSGSSPDSGVIVPSSYLT